MSNLIDIYISSTGFSEINKAIVFCSNRYVNIEISKYARPDNIDNLTNVELSDLKASLEQYKINNISWHGACYDLYPASLDKKIVEVTTQRLKNSIDIARYSNAKTIVFHSGYHGQVRMAFYDKNFVEKQISFWKRFITDNNINDITIALENTYENDPTILAQILDGVNSKYFKICIDTGHVNCYSRFDLTYWIETLTNHLYHFHIHNNFGQNDQHLSLIDGNVDFKLFFDQLIDIRKPVSLTLEMFDDNCIQKSLDFIKQNYSEILHS